MKRTSFSIVVLWVVLTLTSCGTPLKRGAWVVRDQLVDPVNVEGFCREARDEGLDTLVVQVRGRGDSYYQSDIVVRSHKLSEADLGYDPLGHVLESCEDTRLIGWLNVFYLWGGEEAPENPGHPTVANPEWVISDNEGRSVADYSMVDRSLGWIEGLYADPVSPGYRARFSSVVRELVEKYPVDGVHLDFIRYPGPAYGHGGMLGVRFRSLYGFDSKLLASGFGLPDFDAYLTGRMSLADRLLTTGSLLWAGMRGDEVSKMVRQVRRTLDETAPEMELSAAVFPDPGRAFVEKGQNWLEWVERGWLDALYPMAYFGVKDRVGAQLANVAALSRKLNPGVKLWAGLGGYIKESSDISKEARIAAANGFDGVCLFDLGNIRENQGGLKDYAAAVEVSGYAGGDGRQPVRGATDGDELTGERLLASILLYAKPAGFGDERAFKEAVSDRWREFDRARKEIFPPLVASLEGGKLEVSPWVDLRGVFRYVHALDTDARKKEQLELCNEARNRVLAGEEFDVVAAELSQGGTREFGGVLKRRYLNPSSELDKQLLKLAEGELSEVVKVSNGYWFYRVEKRGEPTTSDYSNTPWEAKRRVFRDGLKKALEATSLASNLDLKEVSNK